MGERHGASRRFRTPPAASAVPLTTHGFSLDKGLGGRYELLAMNILISRIVFRLFLGCLNWQRPFLRVVQVNRLTML